MPISGAVPTAPSRADLLADLDAAQRLAVLTTSGPVCILAGAGTGKTRAISRRVAYAVETGAVLPGHVLVVTFTDKAAGEMRERLVALGRPGIAAATFHAAALRQLRHFWPRVTGGELPGILESKVALIVDLARTLPGGYRYVAARDLAGEIEWAKARRIPPAAYEEAVDRDGHDGPLPARLFAPLYRGYERAKERVGRIDFEDMLEMTVRLLEDEPTVAAEVRERYRWFSVDEYQDTNTLQQAVLDTWLGGRQDLAVVGDEDQTIYTFTGASSEWLTGFTGRYPGARVIRLETNYRSTPEVLTLANRLLARAPRAVVGPPKRLVPTRPSGPPPTIRQFATNLDEERAVAAEARRLIDEGIAAEAAAVLVRTNGQLVGFEAAFRATGVPFQLRGERFFGRPEIRRAISAARSARKEPRPGDLAESPDRVPEPSHRAAEATPQASTSRIGADVDPPSLVERLAATWRRALDFDPETVPPGEEARQRHGALLALLEIGREVEAADPAAGIDAFLDEVAQRTAAEADGSAGAGVELLTYHRAKGLEWDAVFLPALEEGLLPIRQASEPAEVEEERRLLYVGITRARVHLWLSSSRRRDGKTTERRRSRFLLEVMPPVERGAGRTPGRTSSPGGGGGGAGGATAGAGGRGEASGSGSASNSSGRGPALGSGDPLFDALRAWRLERARADAMPPYIIFHDSTLAAIAAARPRSLADLAGISGVGPTKLERYGEEVVGVVVREG